MHTLFCQLDKCIDLYRTFTVRALYVFKCFVNYVYLFTTRSDDEDEETQADESEKVPLVHGDSVESGGGYHTPRDAGTPKGFHTPLSEHSVPPSPVHTPPAPEQRGQPLLSTAQVAPPSPSSALMTVSLDAYLEPRRISFESPPGSEMLQRTHSPSESYPVFSPPPIRRRHTLASPSVLQPRTSIISTTSSRADRVSHHTCNLVFYFNVCTYFYRFFTFF